MKSSRKEQYEFLRTPGMRPWRLHPTREKNPVNAVIYDADNRLVAACAYGNAELIVRAVNAYADGGEGEGKNQD